VGGKLEALASALATIDEGSAANLAEFTETGLGDTVGRQIWRALMATRTYPFVSQMRLQAREEGRAEGLAAAIVKVLERRGIEVDDASRARIMSCGDVDALDMWLDRSFVVATASELFGLAVTPVTGPVRLCIRWITNSFAPALGTGRR
jgi:hypothetical protein